MSLLTALLISALADAPQVQVTTLTGKSHSGSVLSAGSNSWKLQVGSEKVDVPLTQILEVRVSSQAVTQAKPAARRIVLTDGTRLGVTAVTVTGSDLKFQLADGAEALLPREVLSSIRFAESPHRLDDEWEALQQRERRQDMLAVPKEKLDFIEGVVGDVGPKQLSLLLEDEPIPVPLEKVFGVVYYRADPPKTKVSGIVELSSGDRIAVQSVSVKGEAAILTLATGPQLKMPVSSIRVFDFSSQKLTWLSSLEPRDVKHEFRFIDPAPSLARDKDVWGEPLKLGTQKYSRGVCIRSKTQVRYRLNGDYSRFQAWMGIQNGYSGEVRVTMSVDGEKILEQIVKPGAEKPHRVDLDVAGHFNLDVLVDFGTLENDIGDHLVLGDARLLK